MDASYADNTAQEQKIGRPFQPGQSGNPKGRPKGSKNKLSQAVTAELLKHFDENGAEAVDKVFKSDPSTYLRICTSLAPKGLEIATVDDFEEPSDDELNQTMVKGFVELLKGEEFRNCIRERGFEVKMITQDDERKKTLRSD